MLRIIGRWALRAAAAIAVAAVLVYAGDWACYELRGTPQSSVQVNRMLVVPLNNGKHEYDFEGTFNESCSVSLFPQGGLDACWWLRRHTNQNVSI
jgi:hypothetical protein